MNYKMSYNGTSSEDMNVIMYDLPEVALPKKNYDTYSIPGRNGELIGSDSYLSNVVITCTFSILSEHFTKTVREIRRWLRGTGKLYLSDDTDLFYDVLAIDYGNIEREISTYGRFSVRFTCYPYEFTETGQTEHTIAEASNNIYDTCMPLYKISGNGQCMLNVNNYIFMANVQELLNVDTRLMICHDADGNYKNTFVSGDYSKLWLKNGQNIISITNGFTLVIKPRWGYSL